MRKIVAVAAGLVAAVGIAAGTAGAQTDGDEAVGFTAYATDTQSIVKTDGGSMVIEDNVFKIKASNGTVLTGMPLKFRVDDFEFPIVADIADHSATLTPQF